MKPRFIDSHAHLGMLEHSSQQEVLARAEAAGIDMMVSVSTDEESWSKNQEIAQANQNIYYTLGMHPHDSLRWAESAGQMAMKFAQGIPDKCVAVGETGLDYYYDNAPKELQIAAFESQLALAKSQDLPVVIHCREAFADLFESIERVGTSTRPGVMHCFTGTTEEALRAIELGFYVSFSGILTFTNATKLRDTAKALPINRLLLETDCPFLAPVPLRGKPNEPSYLPHTAHVLAACHGVKVEEIAEATYQNTVEVFQLL